MVFCELGVLSVPLTILDFLAYLVGSLGPRIELRKFFSCISCLSSKKGVLWTVVVGS